MLVKAAHGARETGREGTNAQSSAYFVRHSRSPKILADFNEGPAGERSRLKTDKNEESLLFARSQPYFSLLKVTIFL